MVLKQVILHLPRYDTGLFISLTENVRMSTDMHAHTFTHTYTHIHRQIHIHTHTFLHL